MQAPISQATFTAGATINFTHSTVFHFDIAWLFLYMQQLVQLL